MNPPEYKNKCDDCKSKGEQMHARIFFRKIKGKWMHLCSDCWEAHRSPETSIAKPKGFSFERTNADYHGEYRN